MLHPIHGLEHPPPSMALIRSLAVIRVRNPPQSTISNRTPQQQATPSMSADNSSSQGESESMVRSRRPSIHYHIFGHGRGYDTRTGISVLGIGTAKVCLDDDMGLHGFILRHYLSMVPVGLFTGILGTRDKRFHWRS